MSQRFLYRIALRVAAPLVLLVLSLPVPARGQADAGQRALAVQLYDQAEALFAQGQVAQACPKYAESYRLDPQLGVLVYLAECFEKNGQFASAWGSFREAEELARARGDARGERAGQRAAALEPRLSYLLLKVADERRVPGLQLLRNGAPVAPVLWGERAAIDAGTHHIEAQAPGYQRWQRDVVVGAEGSAVTVDVPILQPEVAASENERHPPTGNAVVPAGASPEDGPPTAPTANPSSSRRVAAVVVGGVGIVGVGLGAFFGLSAQGALTDAEPLCNVKDDCTPRGDELRRSAKSKALVSTIATGAGVAALATAAVLWFTAPKAEVGSVSRQAAPRTAWSVAPNRGAWGLEMTHAF